MELDKIDTIEVKIEKLESTGVTNPEDEDSDSEMNQSVSALKKDLDAKKTVDNSTENNNLTASEQQEVAVDEASIVSNEKVQLSFS